MQLWAMLSVVISLCSCMMQLESKTHISPLLATESLVAQWLEQPNRSRRVVGSNPIWGSDFSEFSVGSISNFISYNIILTLFSWLEKFLPITGNTNKRKEKSTTSSSLPYTCQTHSNLFKTRIYLSCCCNPPANNPNEMFQWNFQIDFTVRYCILTNLREFPNWLSSINWVIIHSPFIVYRRHPLSRTTSNITNERLASDETVSGGDWNTKIPYQTSWCRLLE